MIKIATMKRSPPPKSALCSLASTVPDRRDYERAKRCFVEYPAGPGSDAGSSDEKLSPVSGWVFSWKDVFPRHGKPCLAGTTYLTDASTVTHPLIEKFNAAGARWGGVTACSELSFSVLGENELYPPPLNPHSDVPRLCGGSTSGGAAAIAMGLSDVYVGTDSGGSVRLPAAWCGIVGFKPTQARCWSHPTVGFSKSFDTVGLLAASVEKVDVAYRVMMRGAGAYRSVPSRSIKVITANLPRLAVPDSSNGSVYQAALQTLKSNGFAFEADTFDPIGRAYHMREKSGLLSSVEGWVRWRDQVLSGEFDVSPRIRGWFESTRFRDPRHLIARLTVERNALIAAFDDAVPQGAVFVTPASPISPPLLTAVDDPSAYEETYRRPRYPCLR